MNHVGSGDLPHPFFFIPEYGVALLGSPWKTACMAHIDSTIVQKKKVGLIEEPSGF
jgi:hypothetical protein